MTLDPDLVGRTYKLAAPLTVERDHLLAFADAVGASHAAYRDPDAARELGFADVVAAPTYAVSLTQRVEQLLVTDPQAGIDFSRVVHGEQQFVHARPLVAGDVVSGQLRVEKVANVGATAMLTSRVDLQDVATGELVCSAFSTLVVRGEQ